MQDKLIEAVEQAIWTANTYPAKGEQPDESSMNDYRRMAESAIAAARAHDAGTGEGLTDTRWNALCRDISDRRGLKNEWRLIDDDVKQDIRAAWSRILYAPPASRAAESAHDAGTDEAKHLSELLCPPHAGLDKSGKLEPFDNCIACIRNERDELKSLLMRISTDCAQTALEDPLRAKDNWVLLSAPVREEIGWRSGEYARSTPASHAAESAPVSTAPECCPHKDEDHVLTAYRRYCKYCSCETKECSCKSWRGINTDCPMHGEGRLKAQDEPTLAEKVHAVMTAGVKDVGVDHFYGKSPVAQLAAEDPAEPVEDVVSRMCKLMGGCACEHCIKRMTAALAVAREGYYSQKQVEQSIADVWFSSENGLLLPFLERFRARLAPKPSLAEEIDTILREIGVCVKAERIDVTSRLKALLDRRTK